MQIAAEPLKVGPPEIVDQNEMTFGRTVPPPAGDPQTGPASRSTASASAHSGFRTRGVRMSRKISESSERLPPTPQAIQRTAGPGKSTVGIDVGSPASTARPEAAQGRATTKAMYRDRLRTASCAREMVSSSAQSSSESDENSGFALRTAGLSQEFLRMRSSQLNVAWKGRVTRWLQSTL